MLNNRAQNNKLRVLEQEKIYNYYIGDKDAILQYLSDVQAITFDTNLIAEFQKVFINITKKVINKLANVYKQPADRYFIDENGEYLEDLTNYYNDLLPLNVNSIDKQALRFAKAFNTSLTYIGFDKKIVYKVLPSHLFNVLTDDSDHTKLLQLQYARYDINQKLYVYTWTDTEHYKQECMDFQDLTVTGNKIPVGDNMDMVNPYGKIPYAILRLEEQNDFWGQGQSDLVNINEQVNFLLSDLINSGVIMQSWGTPFAVNCGLTTKTDKGETTLKKVRIGAKHPIQVENVNADMVPPSFEYKNANPMITEIKDTIDWMIKLIAITKGLDPNAFLADVKESSGFSKVVDAIGEMELRQDDIEPCRVYEDSRFELTKLVLESHKSDIESYQELKGSFVVDFAEIKATKALQDDIKEKEFKLKNNLITPIDLLGESNPDLTDEELTKRYEENKKINGELKPKEDKKDIEGNKDFTNLNNPDG